MTACKCGFDMGNEHYCEHQHGLERTSSCSPDGYVSMVCTDDKYIVIDGGQIRVKDGKYYAPVKHGAIINKLRAMEIQAEKHDETLDARTAEWSLLVQEKEEEIDCLKRQLNGHGNGNYYCTDLELKMLKENKQHFITNMIGLGINYSVCGLVSGKMNDAINMVESLTTQDT